jgi:hypothetical protein
LRKFWIRARVPCAAACAALAAAAEPATPGSRRAWYAWRACAEESLKPHVVALRVARLCLKRHAALASRASAGAVSPPRASLRQPRVGGAASDAAY